MSHHFSIIFGLLPHSKAFFSRRITSIFSCLEPQQAKGQLFRPTQSDDDEQVFLGPTSTANDVPLISLLAATASLYSSASITKLHHRYIFHHLPSLRCAPLRLYSTSYYPASSYKVLLFGHIRISTILTSHDLNSFQFKASPAIN